MADNLPQTLEDRVKERLMGMVAELIPEERFMELTRNTIKQFETVELPRLVQEELKQHYKKLIQEEFAKPEWSTLYRDGMQQPSEMMQELLVKSAPQMFAAILASAFAQSVQGIQYHVRQF